MVSNRHLIAELFFAIDDRDAYRFSEFLSQDCLFRFGNGQSITGKNAVHDVVESFFHSIAALSHEITEFIETENQVVCHGLVTYTRLDNSVLTVPFANIFKMTQHKITEYLIFVDISNLYQRQS